MPRAPPVTIATWPVMSPMCAPSWFDRVGDSCTRTVARTTRPGAIEVRTRTGREGPPSDYPPVARRCEPSQASVRFMQHPDPGAVERPVTGARRCAMTAPTDEQVADNPTAD